MIVINALVFPSLGPSGQQLNGPPQSSHKPSLPLSFYPLWSSWLDFKTFFFFLRQTQWAVRLQSLHQNHNWLLMAFWWRHSRSCVCCFYYYVYYIRLYRWFAINTIQSGKEGGGGGGEDQGIKILLLFIWAGILIQEEWRIGPTH